MTVYFRAALTGALRLFGTLRLIINSMKEINYDTTHNRDNPNNDCLKHFLGKRPVFLNTFEQLARGKLFHLKIIHINNPIPITNNR
jgi:hypothetical protein